MPLIRLQTAGEITDEKERKLLSALSTIAAETIGKPEKYVMVTLEQCAAMMSGEEGNAAFADVRSIGGLGSGVNARLSAGICSLLEEELDIPPERIYINFAELDAANWGWDGSTFG